VGRPSSYGHGDVRNRDSRDQSVSKRAQSPLPADNARHEAKTTQGHSQQHNDKPATNLKLKK
jgi:serine/threonine-protein kinase PRP4